MINIIELESRWFKYKLKSYIPHITIILSSFLIVAILFIFLRQESTDTKISTPITKPVKIIPKVIPIEILKVQKELSTQPIHELSQTIKLQPSLDFMKKMQNSTQPYYVTENTHNNTYEKERVKKVKTVTALKSQLEVKTIPIQVSKTKEVNTISIKRQNTKNDIYEIIKRFKNNNNPALSLFVAKKYYELGNYHQAYNYALITNKINQGIDASWLIFAKSLVKLGKKDQAIVTLKRYIKQSHSNNAYILLDEIKSGKFK